MINNRPQLNFTLPHVFLEDSWRIPGGFPLFLEDSWRIPTIPGGIPYSDVIYHSDRFFKLSPKITLSSSCDLPYMEHIDVIYHSDRFFKLSSNITLSSSCDLPYMEHIDVIYHSDRFFKLSSKITLS